MKTDVCGYLGPMIKHRTVIYRKEEGDTPNSVYFEGIRDFEDEVVDGFHMTKDNYRDFGYPNVVTLTVEPGDLLQEEEISYEEARLGREPRS